MKIRTAVPDDCEAVYALEKACFPPAEAASLTALKNRLAAFPDRFWLLCDDSGKIAAMVNGFLTDEPDLTDEMYEKSEMHNPEGAWQMLFSVCTLPQFQHQGFASALLRHVVDQCAAEGRKGVVLTCKEQLMPFYSLAGFVDEGVSESVHGGAVWHQMRISFPG